MYRQRLRSGLLTVALLTAAAAGWLFLAPMRIGGSTGYVITHGTSMEPRFHTGDLALVRPSDRYKVGDIVAYRSKLLRAVVLHRIIAINGARFVFKGDNNNFIDPGPVPRSALIGGLWLRVPHGGWLLAFLDSPPVAAGLAALAGGLVLFVGGKRTRRRRRASAAQGTPPVPRANLPSIGYRSLFVAALVATAIFLVVGLWSFSRPSHRPAMANVHFTQQATFGYGASVPAGFVYPSGVVRTGDPIFTSLVRRIHVDIAYRAKADAPLKLAGSWRPLLVLSGPSGWHRTVPLGPRERLRRATADTSIALDLSYLQSMLARVAGLTHLPAALYTIGVGANVHVVGAIAGRPVDTVFQPSLNLQFLPQQLQVVGTSGGTGTKSQLSATSTGSVVAPVNAPNAVNVFGLAVDVGTLRLIAVFGFLIAAASALVLLALSRLAKPREELARIRAKYGHMIVPVMATDESLNWVSFDVPTIEALARIAEAGGRVILHHRDEFSDTLLVQDDSAVYRYQIQRPIKWGEWAQMGQVLPGPGAAADTNGAAADDAGATAA